MANIDSETLDKYLVQVRRVAESREKNAEKEILKLYKTLVKELNGFLGNEYALYAEDDSLTYEILYKNGVYARFLEEVNKKIDSVIPEVKEIVDGLVNDTYEKCYNGMVEGVKKSTTAEALRNEFKSVKAVRPEVIKAAVQNPIPKLRLTPTLERNRKSVIYEIKREIGVGLSQGDRMSTMARRLDNRVNINYRQSMLIARTEAHRVRETGLNDAANEVDEILKENGSEYRKIKIWNTCEDSSVRDTHAKMNGVAVLQDEKFELPSGATADCPGTSGVASEDCNCRCFLTHDIVTDEEFYQLTGRHFPENSLTKSAASDTIELTTESNNGTNSRKNIELPENVKGYREKLIRKSDYIEGNSGSFTEDDIRMLCADTGVEYAVITVGDKSILIRGDEKSTDISKAILDEMIKHGGTLDFHTHPYDGDIIPSQSDMDVMAMLEELVGQETSRVISTDGLFSIFNKDGIIESGAVSRKLDDDYEIMLGKIFL